MAHRLILEAALNGSRAVTDHPALPCSPAALAQATRSAAQAGAHAAHFHVRRADGRETLAADDVARAIAEVRKTGVPFGISTGAWIVSDPAQRHAMIAGWTAFPDFASINFDEAGASTLAALLLDRGIGIEAGVANRYAAEQLVASGYADRCLRIMFEPRETTVPGALVAAAQAEEVLNAGGVRGSRLLHGLNQTCWPLLEEAGRRGYSTRIGFEDTLTLPNGEPAPDNAALVRAARQILGELEV